VAADVADTISSMRREVLNRTFNAHIPPQSLEEQWNVPGLEAALQRDFGLEIDIQGWLEAEPSLQEELLKQRMLEELEKRYAEKESMVGSVWMRYFEKSVLLQVLDTQWKEHLAAMDYLRQGIHLRGYAQRNPKQEYKREAFEMFSAMLERIQHEVVNFLSRVQFQPEREPEPLPEPRRRAPTKLQYQHAEASALAGDSEEMAAEEAAHIPFVREGRKIGRNEPCPCGSGRKYKHCHGRLN
jgi:preprotein translocase subunit SecA